MKSRRRFARELALKILYANELNPNNIEENYKFVIKEFNITHKESIDFIYFLVNTIAQNINLIDDEIKKVTKNWDFQRLAIIDKCVLKIGVCELFFSNVNFRIIINEAVELAKLFSSKSSRKFINGVLHHISVNLKESKSENRSNI